MPSIPSPFWPDSSGAAWGRHGCAVRALVGLTLLLGMAACASDQAVVEAPYPYEYRDRHPIVLGPAPRHLDVFVSGAAGLDPRQRDDVRAFAAEYRRFGQGILSVQIPVGPEPPLALHGTLRSIRSELAGAGVPGGRLVVSRYEAVDPTVAAPIRLTFARLQAGVAHPCGEWPQDLGVSDPGFNARNEPYWNFGCAMQSNLAAQVADPVDLARGRPEGRIDTIRRAADIEKLRKGQDPSTQYSNPPASINAIGN